MLLLLQSWSEHYKLEIELPSEQEADSAAVLETIKKRYPALTQHYVKRSQGCQLDPMLSDDQVYCDFASLGSDDPSPELTLLKREATINQFKLMADVLSKPTYTRLLRGKYKFLAEKTDEAQVEDVISALLFLRYKAFRDSNSYTNHKQLYQKLMNASLWSNDADLINAVSTAHNQHWAALNAHRGQHEAKKSLYLQGFMSELNDSMPEQTTEWKNKNFDSWWNESPCFKERMITSLTDYKDKWWTRWFVSRDRTALTTQLIDRLNQAKSAEDILQCINNARKSMLTDDQDNHRLIKSGLKGRFNTYLEEIRSRVISACAPDALDSLIHLEFADIKNVLDAFAIRLPQRTPLDKIRKILTKNKTKNPSIDQINTQYQALTAFFAEIESMAQTKNQLDNNELKSLYDYCKQKQNDLVYYFSQSDQLRAMNQQGSVTVFRAATEAATSTLNALSIQPVKQLPLLNQIEHNDEIVTFKNTLKQNTRITRSSFYAKINQANAYQTLLSELEKSIVEHRKGDTKVTFTALTVQKRDYYHANGFKLNIGLTIDGVETSINYHFNLDTQTAYCDNKSLQQLDACQLPLAPLPNSRIDEFGQKLSNISGQRLQLTTELAQKHLERDRRSKLDKKLQQAYDARLATSEEPLDCYEDFLAQYFRQSTEERQGVIPAF